MKINMIVIYSLWLFVLVLLSSNTVNAAVNSNTTVVCINENYLQINTTIQATTNGVQDNITILENQICPKGCLTGADLCIGEAADSGTPVMIAVVLVGLTFTFFYLMINVDPDDWPLALLYSTIGLLTSIVSLGIINQYASKSSDLVSDLIMLYLIAYVIIGGYIWINTIKNVMQGRKKKHFQGQYG